MAFVEGTSVKTNDYFNRLEVDGDDGSEFIDHWDTGELLFLASSVLRSDRNWVSVARSIKPFGEQTRPADWYTPKNCALQYTKLLSEIDEDSKKKTLPRTERETSEVMLVKNLTDKRLNELAWLNQQTKVTANVFKTYLEMIESGDFDEHLDELLKQIEEREKQEEENYNEYLLRREHLNANKKLNKSRITKGKAASKVVDPKKKMLPFTDPSETNPHQATVEEVIKNIKKEMDTDDEYAASSKPVQIKTEIMDAPITLNALLDSKVTIPSSVAPTSPLLTSLLRSIASTTPSSHTLSCVNSPVKEVKVETLLHQPSSTSSENTQKIDVFLSPSKIPSAGISPLLTSLLKSAAVPLTTHSTSMAATHPKESDSAAVEHSKTDDMRSREVSPRSSVPQSPRPTPASSPLLNSLLKNSPSSTTPILMSPVKDISPKAVSSPQPFFNPTSALATAAAQQLAVATSTLPQSHQFFQQHDLSDSRKITLQSSPITSACLSAPTLSKLLEMPPSTPGRLPPLPVLDPPVTQVPVSTVVMPQDLIPPPPKLGPVSDEVKPPTLDSKKATQKVAEDDSFLSELDESPSVLQKSLTSYLHGDKKPISLAVEDIAMADIPEEKTPISNELNDVSPENIDILEALCETINQAFDTAEVKKDVKEEEVLDNIISFEDEIKNNVPEFPDISGKPTIEACIADSKVSSTTTPEKVNIPDVLNQKLSPSIADIKPSPELLCAALPAYPDSTAIKSLDVTEEDKGVSSKKFYKSRTSAKKEESTEKTDSSALLLSPKKTIQIKVEPQSPTLSPTIEIPATPAIKDEVEETKVNRANDCKSPVAKKPRLFERSSVEKIELSEDDTPVRRSGRRGKKGRGRSAKNTPVKQADPKDQYEFTESTEENSVGYQTANTLCYMPRLKEDSRSDDSKSKVPSAQDSEEAPSTPSTPTTERKILVSLRNKQLRGATPQQISARKSLFTSDEEIISDSLTSDEASNHLLSEDKLKKWEETCEKKGDIAKGATDSIKRSWKGIEIPKKKIPTPKKNSAGKTLPSKKERKNSNVDMEDLSTGSRDSEEVSGTDKDTLDEKDSNAVTPVDMEVETNDSHPSSSLAAESDKQIEDAEGGESFQGSMTTDFSPPPTCEIKEEKETPQFGKQDWLHGIISPKSSEPVSQSSEESEEYESDNWDNQSVSTNKSASHSTGTQPRQKRKERETPQCKAWKKAIHIVLREASCHKNANVFLQKVTNDVAPGYLSIVHRPMDLSLIKKNIDNGVVKTTDEFHRDMLLMFQNAIMYNSSDHDVHQMALEMQRDVIQQIHAFLTTQSNDKDEACEPVSSLRGARLAKAQKSIGKQLAPSGSLKIKEEVDKE